MRRSKGVTTASQRLTAATLAAVVMTSVSTFSIVALGPNPTIVFSDELAEGLFGLREVRDRIVVLTWWVIALLLALVVGTRERFTASQYAMQSRLHLPRMLSLLLPLATFALLLLNYIADLDRRYTDNYPRLGLKDIVVGVLVGLGIMVLSFKKTKSATRVAYLLAVPLFAWFLLSLLQTPASIRDFGHFSFLANELLAPTTQQLPLVSLSPQYTSLLGWPLVPVVELFPGQVSVIAVSWLLLLQVAGLIMVIFLTKYMSGWRNVVPATLLLAFAVLSHAGEGLGSLSSYFSNFPIRTIIPTALYTLLVVFRFDRQTSWTRLAQKSAIGGFVAGLAVLNNPDFGSSAALTSFILIALVTRAPDRIKVICVFLASALMPLVAYDILLRLSGSRVEWSRLLFFQSLFGRTGYLLESMAAGGLHVIFVSFFISGTLISVFLAKNREARNNNHQSRFSVYIGFPAIWGLLSIPYFAGRSFTTSIIGYLFHFALLLIALLGWASSNPRLIGRYIFRTRFGVSAAITVFLLPVIFLSALAGRTSTPSELVGEIRRSGTDISQLEGVLGDLGDLKQRNPEITPSNTVQILLMSNFIEAETGFRSALVTSNPQYLVDLPKILLSQCRKLSDAEPEFLIEMNWSFSVVRGRACAAIAKAEELGSTSGDFGLRLWRLTYIE